ncbi:uncharacterized protein LOC128874911 [Hylaeus volcanicus]|uniref:uncharacterized protein LOC128874911 n=1 Tax=Hylaeus volcanicus TaxID=313075 RepID=UPI0023B805CB|nr:uncharacterized protein LOC128874911 [Hylaeus volcanicus]
MIVHRPTTSKIAACSVEENEETEEPNYSAAIVTTATATTSNNNIETRMRTRSQVFNSIEEGRNERMKLLRQLVNKDQMVDHIDSYFKSLADIAKTWSPLYYAHARRKISNLVSELDIQYLSGNINNRAEEDDSE